METLVNVGNLGAMSDGQLLEHFRQSRDPSGEDAFRVLVERHGPMVLGLCQSLACDFHEAEDAFQATFLVLVHKADSIRKRETIGPWLYGVAGRVARRARARSLRRKKRESAVVDVPEPAPIQAQAEVALDSPIAEQVIVEEIAQLPEMLRAPLLLCCIEDQTYEAAARRLGVSEATIRGRLHRARSRLAARLRRRGILTPFVVRLYESGGIKLPPLPRPLIESTVQFSSRWLAIGGLLSGAAAVPESIAALANGVIQAMILQTAKYTAIVVLLSASVLGTVVVAQGHARKSPAVPPPSQDASQFRQNSAPPGAQPKTEVPSADRALREKTKQLLAALEEPIAMSFANETPLDDVLKYIKQATTTPTYSGIPIYVDPDGLREAKATINSTVQIDQQGVPLRTTLSQALKPLGLSYVVKEGFLMISSRANVTEMRLEEVDRKLDRVLDALQRLESAR